MLRSVREALDAILGEWGSSGERGSGSGSLGRSRTCTPVGSVPQLRMGLGWVMRTSSPMRSMALMKSRRLFKTMCLEKAGMVHAFPSRFCPHVRGGSDGDQERNRVDGGDMEPRDGVRPRLRGLRPLLRLDAREATEGDGDSAVPGGRGSAHERPRVRRNTASRSTRLAGAVASTARRVRELDERPIPRRRAGGLHLRRIRGDGRSLAAHLPGAHEAPGTDGVGGATLG